VPNGRAMAHTISLTRQPSSNHRKWPAEVCSAGAGEALDGPICQLWDWMQRKILQNLAIVDLAFALAISVGEAGVTELAGAVSPV
jgi:hypothetical protein